MNDAPIGFRTFADEDDVILGRREGGPRSLRDSVDEPSLAGNKVQSPATRPRRGRTILVWGTGAALTAGVAIALALAPHKSVRGSSPATSTALSVQPDIARPHRVTVSTQLHCYVGGVSVGSLSLADCGRRNGVASGNLDVGLAPALQVARPMPVEAQAPATLPQSYITRLATPARPAAKSEVASAWPPQPQRTTAVIREARAKALQYSLAETPSRGITVPRGTYLDESESDLNRGADPGDSLQAVQTFYEGLADANGDRAAAVVVPEKRSAGPLSARSIRRFYSRLREPLRIARLYPLDDHTVMVRYHFVAQGGARCDGVSRVSTIVRDGAVLVQNVRALNGC